MRKSEILFGSVILGLGVLLLVGALFDVDLWSLVCPAGLIALGVLLIYRTQKSPGGGNVRIHLAGDLRLGKNKRVQGEENWGFVLDSRFDFTEADLPEGETTLRFMAFVNELRLKIPAQVGVGIEALAFTTESRIDGAKGQSILIPFEWKSANFDTAAKKVWLKPVAFYNEIKIEQIDTGEV